MGFIYPVAKMLHVMTRYGLGRSDCWVGGWCVTWGRKTVGVRVGCVWNVWIRGDRRRRAKTLIDTFISLITIIRTHSLVCVLACKEQDR